MAQNISNESNQFVEDKWKLALDAAGDGMWDLNMQTGEISFSDKWHEIFGYDFSDVSTWDGWAAKIHPDDKGRYEHKVEDVISGELPSYSIEQRFLCKDGTYKWILSRGVIISRTADGKPLRAIGTHHDINDQKLAEAALKASRDIFASTFDHSGIGIALIGPDAKWLDVNNVVCHMTGYTKEELQSLTHYDVTHPDDREIDRGLIDQMLDKDIYTYTIEKRYVTKQKKIVIGLLTVSLVWNSDNTPKFFISQVIDITKKKELENEIKMKNAELQSAKVNLLHKVSLLEELSDNIANNLTVPAANIKAISEALQASHGGDKPAVIKALNKTLKQEEAVELIHENSETIINTLSAIMESAKIKHKEK